MMELTWVPNEAADNVIPFNSWIIKADVSMTAVDRLQTENDRPSRRQHGVGGDNRMFEREGDDIQFSATNHGQPPLSDDASIYRWRYEATRRRQSMLSDVYKTPDGRATAELPHRNRTYRP